MAKNYNPGTINLDAATKSILSSGGGISEKTKSDGITHVSVYSTTENRHLSYDKDKDGNISNVHTDKDNCAYMDYKGGK